MVVKEALNNAVKHSGAHEIRFELLHTGNMLEIKIIDNGRGFHQGHTLRDREWSGEYAKTNERYRWRT